MGIKLERERQAHLLENPGEATPEDVVAAMQSLQDLRRAALEASEAGGGVAVVVSVMPRKGDGLTIRVTAPHMSDERVSRVTANMVATLMGLMDGLKPLRNEPHPDEE